MSKKRGCQPSADLANFQHVSASWRAHRFAASDGIHIAAVDDAASAEVLLGLVQRRVAVSAGVNQHGVHIAVKRHATLRGLTRGERINRDVNAVAAHPQGGGAGIGQRHNRFGAKVVSREQRAHGNGLVDVGESFAREVGVQSHFLGVFGGFANLRHLLHGFQRVFADRGLGAQHDRVGAIEHGIGHVADFSARRHRVGDHALHHLGGGDGDLVHFTREFDHAFLQGGHGGVAHLDGQVAACHHDAVGSPQDFFQMRDGLKAFDFGDQARVVFVRFGRDVAKLSGHFHVGGVFWKADRHIVGLERHGGFDIFHVFAGQCG